MIGAGQHRPNPRDATVMDTADDVAGVGSNPARQLEYASLISRVSTVELRRLDLAVWRSLGLHDTPWSGEGARGLGGRFNPPNSFAVAYGSLSRDSAGAELRRLAANSPVGMQLFLPRHVYRFRIKLTKILDLCEVGTRISFGLLDATSDDLRTQTQLIGELARSLGIEAIIAPSPTGIGNMIAIFTDQAPIPPHDVRHVELWESDAQVPGIATRYASDLRAAAS